MRSRLANLVLSLVVAAGAAVGAAYWTETSRERAVAEYAEQEREGPSAPRDRVRAAIEGVRADGVHVAPDGRSLLDRRDEKALEEALAGLAIPVRVIFWRETTGGGAHLDTDRQLEEAFGDERSVLVVWEGPEEGQVVQTGGTGYVPFGQFDFVGDPVAAITSAVDEIQADTYWHADRGPGSDYWGGVGGGIGAGALIATGVLLGLGLLWLLVVLVSRGRLKLPGRW